MIHWEHIGLLALVLAVFGWGAWKLARWGWTGRQQ